ncbi:prenyltransferase and squalene oxidase repeat family protein [Aphelenchoides avenae]|nr:prenyltransferase and squalene oxidase repeat family protein [Aphelenchus avenae]
MELRYCDLSTEDELVFIRTKRSLILNDVQLETTTPVFQSSVRSFTQIPYLDGEMAIIDGDGKLFWGGIGTAMSRQKTDLDLLEVCATDCPRVLAVISEKEMRTLDLRVPRDPGELIYSHSYAKPHSADLRTLLSDDAYSYVGEREQFSHVSPACTELETFLLTTSRKHLLLDRRMPGKPITSMGHAELDGSDYCITTPPFSDPETGGRAFSVYALSQTRRPCVSHWAVFHHPNEGIWSSLGAPYHLDTPKISRFTECHRMTQIPEDVLPETTRAIHYQALPDSFGISQARALLFRQMEDGSVWYENVLFDPRSYNTAADIEGNATKRRRVVSHNSVVPAESSLTEEFEFKRESLKYARRYLRDHGPSSHAYLEGVSENFLQQPDMQVEIVSAVPEDLDGIDFHPPGVNYDPFAGIGVAQAEAPEVLDANIVVHEPNEDRTLSKVVLNMWDKTKRLCEHRGASAASAHVPVEEDMEDVRSETASVTSQKVLVRNALKLEHKPDLAAMQVDEASDDYNFDVNLD